MSIHNIAFWICAFFLIGVFGASIFHQILIAVAGAFLISIYFIFLKKYWLAALALFIISGAFYYQVADRFQKNVNIPFGNQSEFTGIISELEQSVSAQKIVVRLQSPYSGKIIINAKRYPNLSYGDLIKVKGAINKPPVASQNYYAKNNIFAVMGFPEINILSHNQGNFIKSKLLDFKNKLEDNFKSVLPSEKAAFLSGLTLGEREDFSKEFQNKMSLSGTTHLVALSGYNISIIVVVIMAVLGGYLPAAVSFYLTALVIILFVLMTGAEASVVRAAVMGIIMLLGRHIGREYSLRNAIVIAAFLMILFNPKILVFDLGFQLSFAALLGIVYLSPVIKKIFRISQPGVLSWKENAATTLSAQFAVAPLLLSSFGFFSLSSFFANILILPFVPLAMGLGFIMGGVSFVSYFLAKIISLVLNIFLSYMLWVIDVFSKITVNVSLEKISLVAVVIYYFILVAAIFYANRKSEQL